MKSLKPIVKLGCALYPFVHDTGYNRDTMDVISLDIIEDLRERFVVLMILKTLCQV